MVVVDIAIRRQGLSAVVFSPAPKKDIEYAEYEGEKLLLDREILARCQIKKGSELGVEDLKQLCYVSQCYRAKQRALWHLSQSDHSEKALYEKLLRKFPKKAADFAVAQMRERGYVCDEKYADALAKKLALQNYSKRAALEKMYLKGIGTDLAKEALSNNNFAETEAQRVLALLKTKYTKQISDDEGIKKTVAALSRKGFSFSDIKKALESLLKNGEID